MFDECSKTNLFTGSVDLVDRFTCSVDYVLTVVVHFMEWTVKKNES